MRTNGLSIIEILIVVTLIILFMGIGIPRFQELNSIAAFKKDVSYFLENIGRARALVEATNSRRCGVNDKLSSIVIVRVNTSSYSMDSYCESEPDPVETIPFSLLNSQFDDATSDSTFVTLGTDGIVTPGGPNGFIITRGSLTCTVTISATGVVNTTGADCP